MFFALKKNIQKMTTGVFFSSTMTWAFLASPFPCQASSIGPGVLTLERAVDYALAHQPSIEAKQAIEDKALAGLEKARVDYLPNVYITGEEVQATANNTPGFFLPLIFSGFSAGLPIIEGSRPVGQFGTSAWNSESSFFISKDVLGLLRQMGFVDAALLKLQREKVGLDAQRLIVAFNAADAFMTELEALQTIRAAKAGVSRMYALVIAVNGLVTSDLRPGADHSRAEAELALEQNNEYRAEQQERSARARLSETLGIDIQSISDRRLLQMPPESPIPQFPSAKDPFLKKALLDISLTHSLEHATKLEYLPRVNMVSGLFLNGSGFASGGSLPSPGLGTEPTNINWAAGVILTIPIKNLFQTRAEVHIQEANIKLAKARYSQLALKIKDQIENAGAILESSRRIAGNTPKEISAAQATERQNLARYKAGLATVLEVTEANRLLTRAEVDDAMARINVWRAMLLVARATGNLAPFFQAVREQTVEDP